MTLLWMVSGAALLVALAAWILARRMARQVAQLTEMYWQLKYDHGELKARATPTAAAPSDPQQTFIPLAALKPSSPQALKPSRSEAPKP